MFRKSNNKQLAIILGVICLLYVVGLSFSGKSDRSFTKNLSTIDTAKVTEVVVIPGGKGRSKLLKSSNGWMVETPDGKQYPTDAGIVEKAIQGLTDLAATQIVTRDESKRNEYKVDATGVHVEIKEGATKTMDVILGKSEYQNQSMSSYIRSHDEDIVYLVKGYLSAPFDKYPDDWRDKTIIRGDKNQWTALNFNYPADSSFRISNDNGVWKLDTIALDPNKVTTYLNTLANVKGTEFVDAPKNASPIFQLRIESIGGAGVEINAYEDAEKKYIISSSQNPNVWFHGNKADLYKKIFVGLKSL